MIDVSGFGTGIAIVALQSFPMGFTLSQFADDQDPLTSKEVEPVGYEILYDGSVFAFDKGAPIEVVVSVISGSDDDINLKVLLQAKKSATSIIPLPDSTTMVITYPDGGRIILTNGSIFRGPLVDSVLQTGRRKSNSYTFVFGSYMGAQSTTEVLSSIASAALSII